MANDTDKKPQPAITRYYRSPGLTSSQAVDTLSRLQRICPTVVAIDTELCYHVETSTIEPVPFVEAEEQKLLWLLGDPLQANALAKQTRLDASADVLIFEVGPRFNFSTSRSSNCVSICRSLGLHQVVRVEVSRRYAIKLNPVGGGAPMTAEVQADLLSQLHDRMTECPYTTSNTPQRSFNECLVKRPDYADVDVLGGGKDALRAIDRELGLAFDDADLEYYTEMFRDRLKRNPTTVECFDLAQSNSEHSRHWFFKGRMVVDGEEHAESLIDMIMKTQKGSNDNNVIKFSDNSSAIRGFVHRALQPEDSAKCSELRQCHAKSHLTFTAETHNFPTGVAPFSGATTGPGGRIRDVQSVGRGGHCIAGTAGYCVGNLNIPGYDLPWEDTSSQYPENFASPLDILVQASNGASDYGNKFGEPLIAGFTRTFGQQCPAATVDERREWIKPIMFSGGIGCMNASMTEKCAPEEGHIIAKVGGPVYRIGVGGGAASSVEVQGDNRIELDFNAVQRGDAEMENKLNRVVRACLERNVAAGNVNPILSIHDQGAGGNGNVLKELVEPAGGVVYASRFDLGDPTVNALELWGAEYQESNALLCRLEHMDLLRAICRRERCPIAFVGEVTGSGRMVLSLDDEQKNTPFNLDLDLVLGKMPQKVYKLDRHEIIHKPLELPDDVSIYKALGRVLRLPSVCSKRFLTNKVDRCVTGLVVQQQCVGPLHTPLADVSVTVLSHFGYEGIASSIGEQPIKGLVNTAAGARMTVGEALSNLVFAGISNLRDVKCSGNWMWAAKLPGEGAALFDACVAMTDLMSELGIAIDGGKDSLSMAARVGSDTVKAPGALVVSTYAPCPDVRKVVTPDLKAPLMGKTGKLLYVDLSGGKSRLGGSALAQCYGQLGNETPDVENVEHFKNAFAATQELIQDGAILAGHDVSDGGVITCILEMCFAGMSGVNVTLSHHTENDVIPILFAEELGWILEVLPDDEEHCLSVFDKHKAPVYKIGTSVGFGIKSKIAISARNACIESTVLPLMRMWEETGFQLELLQTQRESAKEEYDSLEHRKGPQYHLTYNPDELSDFKDPVPIKVAVLREEGTNGDRELAAAFVRAGFRAWDVTMQDLLDGSVNLKDFRGVIFPGGFSYADVLGSARGWAATILFHPELADQFKQFLDRPDTFSLGICNGCQLMGLLGWVSSDNAGALQPDMVLDHNKSERFECRWSSIQVPKETQAIMLQGMEGSVLGVWSAHGEGRFTFKDDSVYRRLVTDNCVALRFVDDDAQPTEKYPMNPNGSIDGLAGVCSKDGRHLAMMPHPERTVHLFQWPYKPPSWSYKNNPWDKMFHNAFKWCQEYQ